MNPTTEQLATIAATLAKSGDRPTVTATRALELWRACESVLAYETAKPARQAVPAQPVPLEAFLRAVMPQSKTEDRLKKWRDYLRSNVAFCDREQGREPRTTAALESEVARLVKRDREHGIAPDRLAMSRESFENFLARDTAEKNRERGKKAAAAKKNRASAK